MKKHLFLIAALIVATFTANAQISKGNQAIGLSFSGGSNSIKNQTGNENEDGKNKNAAISFDYSYFVADKTAIGAFLGFTHSDANSISNGDDVLDSKGDSYAFGVFGKKYFMISDKFGGLGQLSLSGSDFKSESTNIVADVSSKFKSWALGTGVNAGFVFFPWKRLGIETSLNVFNLSYNESTTTHSSGVITKGSGYNLSSSFTQSFEDIKFTLRYHFGFKK